MQPTRLGTSIWDPEARELRRDGAELSLTALETRLLGYLADRAGRTVASDELLREVWEYSTRVRTRAVASTVTRLRTKLGEDAGALVTVYGRGYRLVPVGDADLVGRDELVRQVRHTLDATRWVTLFGLGGVGKTSVARAVAQAGPRRTSWVPCGAMRSEAELWSALAEVVELSGAAAPRVVRRALDALGPACLVLDATEHLGVPGATAAGSIVAACPQLHLIATSRFHHGDGVALAVGPLDAASAAALFVQRVQSARAEPFEPDPEALRIVVEQVSGLPLGIELAAARLRVLDLASLAEHLREDPHLVDRDSTSLQAVLEQSWSVLSDEERRTLAAASQFPESFTLDQLGAVTGLPARPLLDALEGLVRASMVLDRNPRFRMLDLVRAFGMSKASPDLQRAFEQWCVAAAKDLWARWLRGDTLPRDMPGYPVPAFERVHEQLSDGSDRAWLALAGYAHASRHGSVHDIAPRVQATEVTGLEDGLVASVRLAQAWMAYVSGTWDEAIERAQAGRAAATRAGDDELRLRCWRLLVAVPMATGAQSEALRAEARALVAEAERIEGHDLARARAFHVCGMLDAGSGRLSEGLALYQRALALSDDDAMFQQQLAAHMGYAYRQLERLDLAIAQLTEAWHHCEDLDVGGIQVLVGIQLADVLAAARRADQADEVFAATAELGARLGDPGAGLARDIWTARRIPDPLPREGALQRVAERAVRDRHPEDAGQSELYRAQSLQLRGQLDEAVDAYDRALTHLAPFGQLFYGTLAHAWRALAQLERGHPADASVPLLASPSPLEASVVAVVDAASAGDWAAVDQVGAQAEDDAVHNTVALALRARTAAPGPS